MWGEYKAGCKGTGRRQAVQKASRAEGKPCRRQTVQKASRAEGKPCRRQAVHKDHAVQFC